MALSNIQSRTAILAAVEEFNRLGREAFLEKHGFGRARRYFLDHDGQLYDSKAIVGVAHGYEFPSEGPLDSSEFSGGEATVKRKLEELGFEICHLSGYTGPHAFTQTGPASVAEGGPRHHIAWA